MQTTDSTAAIDSITATNLCPIWTPHYIHRRRLYLFLRRAVPRLVEECCLLRASARIRVLDIGCGQKPYRCLFNGKAIDVYHGADIDAKHEVEVEELSGRISTADESYDLVVHFQALEHVQRANELLAECYRVLRPGGTLFCTVPSIFEYHGVPDDYRRWTRRGIEADLQGAGFEEVSTIAVEGDWESVLTILELFFPRAVLCEEDRVFRGEALFPLCESAVVSSAWQSNSFVPAHHRCTGAETAELSAIEQMMRSRLVIAADIGGLSDIVDDPGPKFPAAHANGLARCLEQVLKTPNLATEMGEKARQRALSLFGQERMVAEHLDT